MLRLVPEHFFFRAFLRPMGYSLSMKLLLLKGGITAAINQVNSVSRKGPQRCFAEVRKEIEAGRERKGCYPSRNIGEHTQPLAYAPSEKQIRHVAVGQTASA